MKPHNLLILAALLALAVPVPIQAQEKISAELLERFLAAATAERQGLDEVDDELAELDEKIREFEECRLAFDAAAEASGSRMGGLAAKLAMRAKCGASDDKGFRKDRQKLLEKPEKAALDAGGFKAREYGAIKERVAFYLGGMRTGFASAELDALSARASELSSVLRIALLPAEDQVAATEAGGRSGRGGRAPRMAGGWSTSYAWEYIGHLFTVMYISGATIFEKPYEPGQWTRWRITQADLPEERQEVERAFLSRTAEGGEWWRTRSITAYTDEDGKEVADTVTLEALFKPVGDGVQELVRVRGKLPGKTEAEELLVPQYMSMLSAAALPFRPTPESVEGATVGTETVKTEGGSFSARHVRFAAGDGTIEWWLTDDAPGGWVRFRGTGELPEDAYTMELTAHGTGAKSELGVK